MGELLIKPYEISVWEDELVTQDGKSFYKENKLAVIGSNTMSGPDKIYEPVFTKKANGEKTLTFSLKYKYFDPYSGNEGVINPFAALLVNERKVKLNYDGEWYDFIVRDHSESSEDYTWTYTCTDAFVLELSKNGYNITFDAELNNNQGTARDLAKKTLEGTEWRVGGANVGKQLVEEPIYKGTIQNSIVALNTDTNEIEVCSGAVYVFYSYIKNKNGKYLQFIKQAETYTLDDKNVIIATNYRLLNDVVINGQSIVQTEEVIITLGEVETKYHAYRLAYNQLTTYDPTMERTVNIYMADEREIYQYTDYTYTTSNVVTNFITNGENFNLLEDGSLQGWNPYTDNTDTVKKLELVTRPELGTNKELADLAALSQIEGFLKAQFNGAITETNNFLYNTVFNSGIENNSSIIESISKGERFLFRWRAGQGELNSLQPVQTLGLIVATYTQDDPTRYGYYYKHINKEDIIFRFEGTPTTGLDNYVRGGYIENNTYIIDDVVQTPSTKYIYVANDTEYVYDGEHGQFVLRTNSNYLPYYYLTATAVKAVPNTVLSDPTTKIGIFIYSTSGADTYYIQDIQLTRYILDADGQPIIAGNIPTATSNSTDYFYLKPSDGEAAEDIQQYTTLSELANDLGVSEESIVPLYNEGSEKYLSISKSQSNCFDILQTIAETFECWVDLQVTHNEDGSIFKDSDGQPRKYVYLKQYAGKDNYAGFKYGINLQSIERTINSDEIVTKLIVDQSQSDYAEEGFVSIQNAPSNPSGESYILNFDYYYKQGLITNKEECQEDIRNFTSQIKDLNNQLKEKEKQRLDLEKSLTALGSKRNVYTELIDTAKDNVSEGLADFELLTGKTYQEYQEEHLTLDEDDQLTEEDTILDTIGQLYANSAAINNYSGLLTNIESEYWKIRKQLRGSENYKVTIWVDYDSNDIRHVFVQLNDYLPDFVFTLDESTYESTVSKSFFDIETEATEITFTAPQGYSVETPEPINDNKKYIYRITCAETVAGVEDDIEDLQKQKDELTQQFNQKYRRFIQEGTWNSTDYIDSELYYLDALQVSNTSAQPTASYTINVVEISQLEGYDWYLFDAGDKSYVEDTEFFGWSNVDGVLTPAREEVIVSEVEWHLDEPDKNVITVQNYKTKFEDFFQRVSAAVQTVQYNEATYTKISSLLDADGTINQDVLLSSLNNISGKQYNLTSDGSILIDGDQILVRNLTNSANLVKINSEGIRISDDGGASWTTAIDGRGINIGTVYTGKLNTDQVIIGSEDNPSFRWDKSGISAYKAVDNQTYDLQTYVRYDQYGLYGIKENDTFKAQSLQDVLDKAHFAVTWDGFFIRNNYTDGRVEITSDNDFRVIQTVNNVDKERIKIGALEFDNEGHPTLYGIRIKNNDGVETFKTGSDGNVTITGTINATGGNFSDLVTVGKDESDNSKPYIRIDGRDNHDATISSSKYVQDGASYGWMINADGDAVFNNITARGAIKTAVFEYSEIQAVGGVFIFRPSSTIRDAARVGVTDDVTITVEKPYLFKIGDWCKISNYTNSMNEPSAESILSNNGLTHVYKIKSVDSNNSRILVLENAYTALTSGNTKVINAITDLIGGALVDMGDKANGNGKIGNNNYGIGINSSDNVVDLPRRAISLFETVVDETKNPKVSYNYRGILGTLPEMDYEGSDAQVSPLYHNYMSGTQGIYTDNMYIGDASRFLAFYTENGIRKLRIKASDIIFEGTDGSEVDTKDSMIEVKITSSNGNIFKNGQGSTILTCTVLQGNNDITNNVSSYVWKKDGVVISGETTRTLEVLATDVNSTAVYTCDVTFD